MRRKELTSYWSSPYQKSNRRTVYAAKNCPVVDKDTAYKIAPAIRQKKDALIVNLSTSRWSNTKDLNYLTTFDGLNLGFQFGQKA